MNLRKHSPVSSWNVTKGIEKLEKQLAAAKEEFEILRWLAKRIDATRALSGLEKRTEHARSIRRGAFVYQLAHASYGPYLKPTAFAKPPTLKENLIWNHTNLWVEYKFRNENS